MTRTEIKHVIKTVNNYLKEKNRAKNCIDEEIYGARAYERLIMFKELYNNEVDNMDMDQLEEFEDMLDTALSYKVITREECEELFDIINNIPHEMGCKEAQKIINNEGFAWSVTEVVNGDRFITIVCDWQGETRVLQYSTYNKKIIRIAS